MTRLKMASHSVTKARMVEVFDDQGVFVAAIYPSDDGSNTVHIVSKYFDADPIKASDGTPPGFRVHFRDTQCPS